MTKRLRGNTWDHTRGIDPMVATAQEFSSISGDDLEISWSSRSLQEFADYPLEDLASHYDLIVIDHPHIGTAAQAGTLLPIDNYAPDKELLELRQNLIGGSYDCYVTDDHVWALGIDAACHVSAYRPDLLKTPATWEEVEDLAAQGKVLWPLKPVDAICSFQTMAANQGTPCGTSSGLIDLDDGVAVLSRMKRIASHISAKCFSMNPIEALEILAGESNFAYCPLLFGYSNYSRPNYRESLVNFCDIPSSGHLPEGAILGGTGLAVSSQTADPELAVEYALWVAGGEIQRTIYFDSGGQPAHRLAWDDDRVNELSNNFFRDTRRTMELSWTRPRHAGFIDFQDRAGDMICSYLKQPDGDAGALVNALNEVYQETPW